MMVLPMSGWQAQPWCSVFGNIARSLPAVALCVLLGCSGCWVHIVRQAIHVLDRLELETTSRTSVSFSALSQEQLGAPDACR